MFIYRFLFSTFFLADILMCYSAFCFYDKITKKNKFSEEIIFGSCFHLDLFIWDLC